MSIIVPTALNFKEEAGKSTHFVENLSKIKYPI